MHKQSVRSSRVLRLASLAILACLVLLSSGCRKGAYLQPCGNKCVRGGVWVSFSQSVSSVNAWSVYETREVDPNVYAHDPTRTPMGVVSVTLNNGSTVTYSGALVLDTSTSVSPTTSGHSVLVYRPANPSGLQAFINQYKDQAVSVDIDTAIDLKDISNGAVESSVVDFKANYNGTLSYIGSMSSTPPSGGPFNQDL